MPPMTTSVGSDKAPERIAAWITATAPKGTAVAVDRIRPSAAFDAKEEAAIARAVAHRRDEFTTGRRLAREALARLGCLASSLPPDPDRVPRWPDGFVGTISHSGGLCAALVGRDRDLAGIGIDVEEIARMQPGLASLICRPDEADVGETDRVVDLTLLRFVAKEAFFKAYFPAARGFLDFLDVRVSVDPESDHFEAQLMKPSSPSLCGSRAFDGRFAMLGSHVVAGVWIAR
jgi:4'-phosphopantetheinyl transferase EntD